jgi:hypothetical protein
MDIQLRPEETELVERWERRDGRFVAGATGERIHQLTTEYLTFVRADASGWERLFRDPKDGRYWELTFPHGEMHGGGPRKPCVISEEEASRKYPG